ncbi:DnaT-like ssDNA-binding protein [Pseudomonas sp. NPDC088444]|uniref:DnaT-like ssDNA-binding protein n=1 Tax=Pseudomonas sp. NPDC088444 TaxID=3364456 RepID=UPI00384A81AD
MALVIEDGSIVPGAESYATAAELVTYAANFGRTIPDDILTQEALLRRAALQMESLPWKGQATYSTQSLAWPRGGVCRQRWEIPANVIPPQIKAGQMALATEIYADDLVDPATKQGAIVSETVGPISTTFASASTIVTKAAAIRQSYAQFTGLVEASSQVKLSRS